MVKQCSFFPEGEIDISPRQSEAASAAKRRPESAFVVIFSPVKGDTNGTNTDCAALNRAGVINVAYSGQRFAAVAGTLCRWADLLQPFRLTTSGVL